MDVVQKKYAHRKRQAERERKIFLALTERLYLLKDWQIRFAPKSPDEVLDPRFVEASHDLPRVEYPADTLCAGDEIEKREAVKELTPHQIPPKAPETCVRVRAKVDTVQAKVDR